MSESNGWAEYDGLVDELEKDARVGDHDFMVTDVESGKWSDIKAGLSDDPFYKIGGVLLTANQAKAGLQWSPPPPASVVKSEMASWKPGKRKAIAQAVALARALETHYGKKVADLKANDVIRVKTVKTQRDEATGKGGFIRIAAILPKEQIGQASKEASEAAGSTPF